MADLYVCFHIINSIWERYRDLYACFYIINSMWEIFMCVFTSSTRYEWSVCVLSNHLLDMGDLHVCFQIIYSVWEICMCVFTSSTWYGRDIEICMYFFYIIRCDYTVGWIDFQLLFKNRFATRGKNCLHMRMKGLWNINYLGWYIHKAL